MTNDISFLPEQDTFATTTNSRNFEEILEAQEWAEYRADLMFDDLPEGTTRAAFIDALRGRFPAMTRNWAGKVVDGVIAHRAEKREGPYYAPGGEHGVTFGPDDDLDQQHAQNRKLALKMYLEKRAGRPRHDPLPLSQASASSAEGGMLTVEERRALMGLPSGLLRSVDYQPGIAFTPPTWLVKNLLPSNGVGMLVGESQAGKSFLSVHAAVCVARGVPFFGRKVKPGGVLYIAAEGGRSVLARINAADEAIGGLLPDNHMLRAGAAPMARAPIKVVVETPNLARDGDPKALERTIEAAAREFEAAGHRLALVIVDTWHASLGGADEQAAADTGHALKPLKSVVEKLGLLTLIVHHFGKDLERGARGSGALRAAVDTEIELRVPNFEGSKAKPAAVARRATLTKQRDGAVGEEFHFHMNTVQLGVDEDGDPWTTCTVSPCDAPASVGGKPMGKGDLRLRRAFDAAHAEHGGERVPMKMVRGYFNNAGPADEKEEARRQAFRRATDKAREAGVLAMDANDEWVWLMKGGDGPE